MEHACGEQKFSTTQSRDTRQENKFLSSNNLSKHLCLHKSTCKSCEAAACLKLDDIHQLLSIHEQVQKSGKYNFQGCRIKVNNKINVDFMRNMLTTSNYKDLQVCDLLEFGFPIGFEGSVEDCHTKNHFWQYKNHKGATEYSEDIHKYIQKESRYGAIIGPFKNNPFKEKIVISPLNSVPKKDTSERRIIMDLSFPKGHSVNDFIDKDKYLEEECKVIFPKVDDFVELIKSKGQGCLLYKRDLKRAYRQISIDPKDLHLVSFIWNKHIFCDSVLSMGLRSAANICQRTTNAISYIMLQIGIAILNYLDDLAGAERKENAKFAFFCFGEILKKCVFEESAEKAFPPSEIMSFLGILFNTLTMTIEITTERLQEIRKLIQLWLNKDSASLKQVQSLLGKLNFIAACVKPSRIFVARLLNWLRSIYGSSNFLHTIPHYVKKDLIWWNNFLPLYNGISMMEYENWSKPDAIFSSDSCLTGCGGFWNGFYFHTQFPAEILEKHFHISVLEMLAVIIALKLWGARFKGLRIVIYCDNKSVCDIISSGKSRSEPLQDCLREICYLASIHQFEIKAQHLTSEQNRISDLLSRWHLDKTNETKFKELTEDYSTHKFDVRDYFFNFINDW